MATFDEEAEPFLKENTRLRGNVHGVHSKSKIPSGGPNRRIDNYRAKGALDIFTIAARPGNRENRRKKGVIVGNEVFVVNGIGDYASVHYSLNRNRRWEYIENLDEVAEADSKGRPSLSDSEEEKDHVRHRHAVILEAENTDTFDSDDHEEGENDDIDAETNSDVEDSTEEDDFEPSSPDSEPHSHSGHFHVYHKIRQVTSNQETQRTDTAFTEAKAKIKDAKEKDLEAEGKVTHSVIMTRKGRKVITHRRKSDIVHHVDDIRPVEQEMAGAEFLVTIDRQRREGENPRARRFKKIRGCPCSICNPRKRNLVPRNHKYEGSELSDL